MTDEDIPFDILEKIESDRNKPKNKRIIEVSKEEFETITSKRIHDKANKRYTQTIQVGDQNYIIRWSSNKKTQKQIKDKIVERHISTTIKPVRHGYHLEKVKTGDNKVWYLKYKTKKQRQKQMDLLIQNIIEHYGVDEVLAQKLRTINRRTMYYIRFKFTAKNTKL